MRLFCIPQIHRSPQGRGVVPSKYFSGIAELGTRSNSVRRSHAAGTTRLSGPASGDPSRCLPLFHATGSHAVYLASYRHQRKLVAMYKWDAAIAAQLIEAEKINSFIAPAAMTGDLLASQSHPICISVPCYRWGRRCATGTGAGAQYREILWSAHRPRAPAGA